MLLCVVWQNFTDISEVLTSCIIIAMRPTHRLDDGGSKHLIVLMMDAVKTSETSVNFYQTTRCNIPEDITNSPP
jgi:hypothetical protein